MKANLTAEQLKAILESVHDAIYIGDQEGISICNKHCVDMLGCGPLNELAGGIKELNRKTNSRFAASGEKIPLEKEPFMQALKGAKVVEEIIITNCTSGEEMFIRCAASPIIINNKTMGAVAVNTDITQAKLGEKKLREALGELENVNKELNAFTYAVSHDLKSPLNSIYGLAAILLKSDESTISDKDKYMINLIMQSSEKLSKLINQLLELSRISKMEVNYGDVNISNIGKMVLDNQGFQQERKAEVEIEENLVAYGDEALLHSVVQNLLSNAIKYSSRKKRPKIKMGAKTSKEKTIFYVQDNGAGFDPSNKGDLFKPFKRLHHNSEFSGTGIGLSTVKRIIERHGGHVWAEAEPGKGATFYFSLPDRAQMAHLKDREPIILKGSLKKGPLSA